jgi:hypothetical protein
MARAKVVWARDMGPAKNQELLDYYPTRRVWTLRLDDRAVTFREIKATR